MPQEQEDINQVAMTFAPTILQAKNFVTNRQGEQDPNVAAGTFIPGTFEFDDEESLAHEIGIKASMEIDWS